MRAARRVLLLLVLALPGGGAPDVGATHDGEAPLLLVPATNGTFLAGAVGQRAIGTDLDPAEDHVLGGTHHTWALEATDCHRRLAVNLTYRPGSLMEDPEALVDAPYLMDIAVTFNNTTWTHRVFESPEDRSIGTLPGDGAFTVDLILRQGVHVDWTFALTARQALNCDGGVPL